MEEQVKAFIEKVRPYIQSHGGDVEFVEMQGETVHLRLLGACHACPHALSTLHQGIETQLRQEVSPTLSVQRVM